MYIFGSDRQRCINFNIMFFWLKFVMNNFFKRVEWMLPEFTFSLPPLSVFQEISRYRYE